MSFAAQVAPAVRWTAWLADVAACAVAVVGACLQPRTWRRTVRAEFLRFLDIAGVQNLTAMAVTAALVGLGLIAQATYWLARLGDQELVRTLIAGALVREIAPLVAAFLVVGRGGFEMLSELVTASRRGTWRSLQAAGVDPFAFLVVPRAVALAVSMFCLAIIFIVVAMTAGYLTARIAGFTTRSPGEFVLVVLHSVGDAGYLLLPIKTVLMGLVVGAVCAVTSLDVRTSNWARRGLIRSAFAIFLISGIVSATL